MQKSKIMSKKKSKEVKKIKLNAAEIQSSKTRVDWAEGLITQLPTDHDGAKSWLINYGVGEEARNLRGMTGIKFDKKTTSAELRGGKQPILQIVTIPLSVECSKEQRDQDKSILGEDIAEVKEDMNSQSKKSSSKTAPGPDDLLYDALTQGGQRNLSLEELLVIQDFSNHLSGLKANANGTSINNYYATRWHSKDFS